MSERFEDEVMDDLYYEGAEGPSALYRDDFEEDYFEDEWESMEEDYYEDDFEDEFDEDDFFEEEFSYADEEEMIREELEDVVAHALGAEDTDEVFRNLWKGLRQVAKRAAPIVGRIARTAAPIAGLIPGYGTAIGAGLNLLGNLRAEGASVEEALDAFAELAAYDEAVKPIVSGLAVRSLVKDKAGKMPKSLRKKMVRDISQAQKTLAKRSGEEEAARAIPKIVRSVKKKGPSPKVATKTVRKVAAKIAKNPRLQRKLSKPSPKAKAMVKKALARRKR